MAEWKVQRHEEKYRLSAPQAAELELMLSALLQKDRYSANGAYFIRSLYFDTADDADYNDKLIGADRRQKLRLRLYHLDSPAVKLEIKNKTGSLSYKQSTTLTRAQALALANGDCEFLLDLPGDTARRAYTFFRREQRRPTALVDYERTAFTSPVAQVRITLDRNIRAAKTSDLFGAGCPMFGVHSGGVCVLEVKYDAFLPRYLRGVLTSVGPAKMSIGKYELARQLLDG